MSVKLKNVHISCQAAVIPVKSLAISKSRLSNRITSEQRMALSLNLLNNILKVVTKSSLDEVVVLGSDMEVAGLAKEWGVDFVEDGGGGLNHELKVVIDRISVENKSCTYIAADLPFLDVGDIEKVIELSNRGELITICPSGKDNGTNGLLLPPGSLLRPNLGKSSYSRHKHLANKLSSEYVVCCSDGWGTDLDLPEDLDKILEDHPDFNDRMLVRNQKDRS